MKTLHIILCILTHYHWGQCGPTSLVSRFAILNIVYSNGKLKTKLGKVAVITGEITFIEGKYLFIKQMAKCFTM